MHPESLVKQNRMRAELENVHATLAELARESVVGISGQPPDASAARGWLERAHVVTRLIESSPVPNSAETSSGFRGDSSDGLICRPAHARQNRHHGWACDIFG